MSWCPHRDGLVARPGGVTAAAGFRAGGVTAGLKPSGRPDLALVVSDAPATVAITTTRNHVRAAPCVVTERNARNGRAQAVVLNSGGANACTGAIGLEHAEMTAGGVAAALGLDPADVLVCSTGVIGVPLAVDRLLAGVPPLVADLSVDGGGRAAGAIVTTDRVVKEAAYAATDTAGSCLVGGMAKGAGMIEPSMATMLAVITTDAPVPAGMLRPMVRQVVERTFNRICVDACGSTNDTVIVLANGQAERPPTLATFQHALEAVCADLARAIVADGEGATRVAELTVGGAATEEQAAGLARAISGSVLVRAALHGGDPNWGRILAAMGARNTDFDPDRVAISFGGVTVCRDGLAAPYERAAAATALSRPEVVIDVDLGLGSSWATVLVSDLTPQYVTENAYYTT